MPLIDERDNGRSGDRLNKMSGGMFGSAWDKDPAVLADIEERKREDIAHTKRHLMSMPTKERCSLVADPNRLVAGDYGGDMRGSHTRSVGSRDSHSRIRRAHTAGVI